MDRESRFSEPSAVFHVGEVHLYVFDARAETGEMGSGSAQDADREAISATEERDVVAPVMIYQFAAASVDYARNGVVI